MISENAIDLLHLFAEVIIGIAGFTAIVSAVRGDGGRNFTKQNSMIFNGMLTHCCEALFFSLTPLCLILFIDNQQMVWKVMSVVLGLVTAIHMGAILRIEWRRGWAVRILTLVEIAIGLALILNVLNKWKPIENLYTLGVFVHVFQSFFLFVMMMYIPVKLKKKEGD